MKKLFSLLVVLVFMILAVAFTGCKSMFDNIKEKSYNVAASGLGGKFTTAIDPSTGTPCPSMDIGSIDTSVMSHKPGDGTQVSLVTQKSFWGSEVGSQTCKINCKSGIRTMTISTMPQGPTVIAFEEYDVIVETAGKFSSELELAISKNSTETNAKIRSMLAKIREHDAADAKTKERFAELAAMSDTELFALKASDDLIDNKLIGNEVLWRVINKNKTAAEDTAGTPIEANKEAHNMLIMNYLQDLGSSKMLCAERGFISPKEPIADAKIKV